MFRQASNRFDYFLIPLQQKCNTLPYLPCTMVAGNIAEITVKYILETLLDDLVMCVQVTHVAQRRYRSTVLKASRPKQLAGSSLDSVLPWTHGLRNLPPETRVNADRQNLVCHSKTFRKVGI